MHIDIKLPCTKLKLYKVSLTAFELDIVFHKFSLPSRSSYNVNLNSLTSHIIITFVLYRKRVYHL